MENSAKILLLGKTGVGKSAFINYFLGKKVAESAAGKPVTQEYFIPYEISEGRYPILIYDTKGLEMLNANNQLEQIIKGIKKKNNSEDIFNWFHTIFYCVSMFNQRFELFERDLIKRLQKELTQHIHIILTYCDTCTTDKICRMKEYIISQLGNQDNIEIFEVVSVGKKKRNGTEVQPHGREIIYERVFDLLLEDISYRVSCDYAKSLEESIISVADMALLKMEKFIDKKVRLKTLIEYIQDKEEAERRINIYTDQLDQDIEFAINKINEQFNTILQPVAKLYLSYRSCVIDSVVEDAGLNFENLIDLDLLDTLFNEKTFGKGMFPNMYKKGYMNEDGDFIDMDEEEGVKILWAIVTAMGDIIMIRRNLKRFCRRVHKDFIKSIPSKSELQKEVCVQIARFIKS